MLAIKDVQNVYLKHVFTLEFIGVDGQFEPLWGELTPLSITLNKCSREEHVPVVERSIRILKERWQWIQNTLFFKKLPGMSVVQMVSNTLFFKKLPGMLVVQMVSVCNFWFNIYPPTDGISRNINPRELMTGTKIDYNKHMRAEFGEYFQVHEEHDNSMNTHTTGVIATKPTVNVQGGHWFYSLISCQIPLALIQIVYTGQIQRARDLSAGPHQLLLESPPWLSFILVSIVFYCLVFESRCF